MVPPLEPGEMREETTSYELKKSFEIVNCCSDFFIPDKHNNDRNGYVSRLCYEILTLLESDDEVMPSYFTKYLDVVKRTD